MIGGFTTVAYNMNQVGLRQAITPDRMLGRMNATMRLIVWGTIPIGALIGGFLGGIIGLQADALGVGHRRVRRVPARSSSRRCGTLREIPAQAE